MNEVFELATTSARWGLAAIGMLPVLIGVGLIASSLNTPRAEISQGGLRLRGELYGRFIPKADLKLDRVREVNLASERDLEPTVRTFGTALPGYKAGWFRLRNGESALLYVTDRSKAVLVPTTKGYSVIVTPKDRDRFLEGLAQLGR